MGNKSDFNKIVYGIIALLLVIVILTAAVIAVRNSKNNGSTSEETFEQTTMEGVIQGQEAEISEIEAGALPTDNELKEAGLIGVKQTNAINQQFNLNNYEITDNSIKYNYLANAVTSGERLSITARVMTEEEYNEMLPKAKAVNNTVDNVNVVYNDRSLYNAVDGEELPGYIANAEKEGNVVVRYGSSIGELLPMQQIMWYQDGIGYTLESVSRNYTYDDMAALLHDFFEAVK